MLFKWASNLGNLGSNAEIQSQVQNKWLKSISTVEVPKLSFCDFYEHYVWNPIKYESIYLCVSSVCLFVTCRKLFCHVLEPAHYSVTPFFWYISPVWFICPERLTLNPQAGRPGLPPLKCIGRSNNNNTAANSGLSTWGSQCIHERKRVADGRVVRAGVSVTWNVPS